MAHVQATGISLAYGDRDILRDVTLNLSSGDRCALAGANGSGKSTLMKIIAGTISPDTGSIQRSTGISIVYLPQSGVTHSGRTLGDEIELVYDPARGLIVERDQLGQRLAELEASDPRLEQLIEEHHVIQERILHSGYYDRDEQIDRVLRGLGFISSDRTRLTHEFSGGWQMRIALAKTLLCNPDMLLLDEPTNYLDLEARIWLGEYLAAFPGGVLLVSHDRRFLDETVTVVWELFLAGVTRYKGNYTEYEHRRAIETEQITAAWQQQQEEIRRIDEFIRRFRATASKARQVQSRIKQLEKMEPIVIPEHLKPMRVSFPPAPRSGDEVIRLVGASRSYGKNAVLRNVDLTVTRGERVVLVGPNGAGKSTLMRLISGHDREHTGALEYGAEVRLGFYADDDNWLTEPHESRETITVFDAVVAEAHGQTEQRVRDLLGAFLFRGDDVYKSVGVLSGGERSRLALLQLLLRPLNLLVLDEPTNHLDMTSKDVLIGALEQFGGTIVFVSHDRDFVSRLATRVVEITPTGTAPEQPSRVVDFAGDYDYYAWRVGHADADATVDYRPSRAADGSPPRREDPSDRATQKARRSRLQQIDRRVEQILAEIDKLQHEHDRLQHELADPGVYGDGDAVRARTARLTDIDRTIEGLTTEWDDAVREQDTLTSP